MYFGYVFKRIDIYARTRIHAHRRTFTSYIYYDARKNFAQLMRENDRKYCSLTNKLRKIYDKLSHVHLNCNNNVFNKFEIFSLQLITFVPICILIIRNYKSDYIMQSLINIINDCIMLIIIL